MAIPFQNELVMIGTILGVAIGGYFQVVGSIRRQREESDRKIKAMIDAADQSIKSHLDKKIELVDTKFSTYDTKIDKNEEDIQDIEIDMKNMVQEFKAMCEKLSHHGYIIDDLVPDFKALQKEFYNFKSHLDQRLTSDIDGPKEVVNRRRNKGSDLGDKENVSDSGEIQE